jgi:hypothetical protein
VSVFAAIHTPSNPSDFAPRVVEYNRREFDFPRIVAEILHEPDLQSIVGAEYARFTRETDQSTIYHKSFYMQFEALMGDLYRRFVSHMSDRVFGDVEVYHQAVPTFRVQFPNNLGVAEMHKDSDYRHQNGELNFWVPLTPVWGSNTIWVEASRGGHNYQPWTLKPGQVLVFDSVNWRHGNITNTTGRARVSFDFRMIPAEKFIDAGEISVSAHKRMSVGDYWEATCQD